MALGSHVFANGLIKATDLDAQKYTVCAMTINSSEEIELFKQSLDPKFFNPLVELTLYGDGFVGAHNYWLDQACQTGIQCDQLLVSSHFASGKFFGVSEKHMELSDIEKKICENENYCPGILSNPLEVYLFACNTLAGKELDHRGPEVYEQILLADGLTPFDAQVATLQRYGQNFDSNIDRVKTIFYGEPKRIYGFDSVAPLGVNIQSSLDKYLKKIGPLEQHLSALAHERAKIKLKEIDDYSRKGSEFERQLKKFSVTSCSVLPAAASPKALECELLSNKLSLMQRFDALEELLANNQFDLKISAIDQFAQDLGRMQLTEQERSRLNQIMDNAQMSERILEVLKNEKSPVLRGIFLLMAQNFSLLPREEIKEMATKELRAVLSNADQYSFIRAYKWIQTDLNVSELPEALWEDPLNNEHIPGIFFSTEDASQNCESFIKHYSEVFLGEKIFTLYSNPLFTLKCQQALLDLFFPDHIETILWRVEEAIDWGNQEIIDFLLAKAMAAPSNEFFLYYSWFDGPAEKYPGYRQFYFQCAQGQSNASLSWSETCADSLFEKFIKGDGNQPLDTQLFAQLIASDIVLDADSAAFYFTHRHLIDWNQINLANFEEFYRKNFIYSILKDGIVNSDFKVMSALAQSYPENKKLLAPMLGSLNLRNITMGKSQFDQLMAIAGNDQQFAMSALSMYRPWSEEQMIIILSHFKEIPMNKNFESEIIEHAKTFKKSKQIKILLKDIKKALKERG